MSLNIVNSFKTIGVIGGWKELGRTTLGASSPTIDVSGLANKRYYMILSDWELSGGGNNEIIRLNGDAANQTTRFSFNGGVDGTVINQGGIRIQGNGTPQIGLPQFNVGYFTNLNTAEKSGMFHSVLQSTAGAATAPNRTEAAGKHAQTVNPIDQFTLLAETGTNTHITNSEMVVLEWDPSDLHTDNFWQELASVTLTVNDDIFDTGTFAARKYLWIQIFLTFGEGANTGGAITFNDDAGLNYSQRISTNGGVDFTQINQPNMLMTVSGLDSGRSGDFFNAFMINNSANEKLLTGSTVAGGPIGSASAPERREWAQKWTNTASQITKLTITSEGATRKFGIGSTIKIWGSN